MKLRTKVFNRMHDECTSDYGDNFSINSRQRRQNYEKDKTKETIVSSLVISYNVHTYITLFCNNVCQRILVAVLVGDRLSVALYFSRLLQHVLLQFRWNSFQ